MLTAYTVTNTLDNTSAGSLRWAVAQADASAGPNTINFNATDFATAKTITLTAGPLVLSEGNTTITGPAAGLTINGNQASRVFTVTKNVTASLSGLTITGGAESGYGAGMANYGTVSLTNCTVSGNSAVGGSTVGSGGGLYNSGTASLTTCTITGNSAGDNGGGLYNIGTVSLTNCTVSDNSANYGAGGGLFNDRTATLSGCTVNGNGADEGGGIENSAGSLALTDCTVSGNVSGQQGGPYNPAFYFFSGGGVQNGTYLANTNVSSA